MLKPKGLGQDTLIGLFCGDVRASPVTPPGVLIFIFIFIFSPACPAENGLNRLAAADLPEYIV